VKDKKYMNIRKKARIEPNLRQAARRRNSSLAEKNNAAVRIDSIHSTQSPNASTAMTWPW